ncbi:uncharacterized protein [Porites lutea]|uniref:uncharacterized protein n=1 Tax=Porites lutea TaxID=51062 RepID=UPI003CC58F16
MPNFFDNGEFALILSSVQEGRGFNLTSYYSNNSYSKEHTAELKSPSVESFIRASTTSNSVKCFAVYLNLTNACQTLDDVSKVKAQVPKIALVTLVNESTCTLQELAENVQNAGYSVLIYFAASYAIATVNNSDNKVLIPVAIEDMTDQPPDYSWYSTLSNADLTYVDIFVYTDELTKMKSYLKRLYFWFLIGPLITLEWMRRTRKFCWMSDSQDDQREAEERTTENERNASENEIRTMEEGENGNEESRQLLAPNYQGSSFSQRSCEEQPLFDVEYTRQTRRIGRVKSLKKFFHKGVLCFSYLILIFAALPMGISSGGFSFFRFDHGAHPGFLDVGQGAISYGLFAPIAFFLFVLLWSPIQIFCFLLYSRLACTSTWVVPINFLKLIRSDWFASNIFLLFLAVEVPLCTSTYYSGFFACYNAVCTMCNLLFLIILNKHKFVTRYVFYISVCMIFAYLESSIVAVFYFVLSSEVSSNNLQLLTTLRTVAIGLTLKVSFSSSMHIIRKLNKPVESLFEGLSEK